MAHRTKQALIISAWPCTGKTTFARTWSRNAVVDLDSSAYDLKSTAGTKKYVHDIEARAKDSPESILLVSSHEEVRLRMRLKGLELVPVSVENLEDWKERQQARVSGEDDRAQLGLLEKGIAEWDSWKMREEQEEGRVVLEKGQYLGSPDIIEHILKRVG